MKTVRTAPLAAALAVAFALGSAPPATAEARSADPVIRISGDTTYVVVRAPRPTRVFEMDAPHRVVVDFPGEPMEGYGPVMRTCPAHAPGLIAVRRGQVKDGEWPHARLSVVLEHRAAYDSRWSDSTLTLALVPGDPRFTTPRVTAPASPARPGAPRSAAPRPSAPAPQATRPQDPLLAAARALEHGDAAGASQALKACPSDAPAGRVAPLYARLALLEGAQRLDPASVEAHAREALQLGTESVRLDLCLGRALDRQKRWDEAARWFRRATQITADPARTDFDRRSAFFLWADAVYRIGRSAEDARAAYDEALDAYPSAPEAPWALYQSSKLSRRLGHADEARRRADELATRFPNDYWTAQSKARFGEPSAALGNAAR